MTQNEYRDIISMLSMAFPAANKYKDRGSLNDGWMLVKDRSAEEITEAARTFMLAYPYPPDIAELARMRKIVSHSPEPQTDGRIACHIIHTYGGVVGETLRDHYPSPLCDKCKRRGDEMRCYGLLFGRKDEGKN